ncbi:MAG: hypothetical protein HFJ79_09115 [Clostridiales bacterium]|jgi:uridine kinase|nr:hypothetical protein [Clostridiales bacterium]
MKRTLPKRDLKLETINRRVQADPTAFVEEENRRYEGELEALTRTLAVGLGHHGIVMLSGPSSSGKTTTALKLAAMLREMGIDAHVVSLDNFYRGRECAPRLPDGRFDYEALEALDLDQLQCCLLELVQTGKTRLPRFDFITGKPAEQRDELVTQDGSVVIFEGIHAINPVFEEHLPQESMVKVFVNTITPIYDREHKLLARRSLRLIRRVLRDERFRASPVDNTMDMWPQVIRGENEYMFPYVDTVDYVVDTTQACEPAFFRRELLPLLRAVPADSPWRQETEKLAAALEPFLELPLSLMPGDSLLREFVGETK